MIKCEKCHAEVKGEKVQILAEYTLLLKMLLDDFSEEELKRRRN